MKVKLYLKCKISSTVDIQDQPIRNLHKRCSMEKMKKFKRLEAVGIIINTIKTWYLVSNSTKSPWVLVYVSNFRHLIRPLLIDFGEGSSSCCCDTGKTKSTPSLKT